MCLRTGGLDLFVFYSILICIKLKRLTTSHEISVTNCCQSYFAQIKAIIINKDLLAYFSRDPRPKIDSLLLSLVPRPNVTTQSIPCLHVTSIVSRWLQDGFHSELPTT